jgi:hypothetical protein
MTKIIFAIAAVSFLVVTTLPAKAHCRQVCSKTNGVVICTQWCD